MDQIIKKRELLYHLLKRAFLFCSAAREPIQRKANSEPRRQYVAALHPPEPPWNRPQVTKSAPLVAPRRTRAQSGMLQFPERCGFFKIWQDIRIVGDHLP